jgi:hypothetical protein
MNSLVSVKRGSLKNSELSDAIIRILNEFIGLNEKGILEK